jgi:class 3 adenylate cyclase/tetratricopeptide (TPR) repeat protein
MTCGFCKAENPDGNRFCGRCGAILMAPGQMSGRLASRPERRGGERRRLVVMFSDVASSTEIAGRLDPEEWRDLLVEYHETATRAVIGMGGYVAQYLGDGVLAYFGWPVAHENDAERAALAGHALLDGIAELNRSKAECRLVRLGIRIGIHAGEVVLNPSGEVYGDVPNVSSRVQSLATVGTVVITEPVFRALGGRLATEDLGAQSLKGVDRPVQLYRVLSPRGPRRRFRGASPSRFVGRATELLTLLGRWKSVQAGKGQIVTVTGEAGIGKSRLVQEFHLRVQGTRHLWLEARGSEIFRSTPFHPVVRLLDGLLGAGEAKRLDGRQRRLRRLLRAAGMDDPESLLAVEGLLGTGPRAPEAPDTSRAAERRVRQLHTLVVLTLRSVRRRPGVIVLEDLHWMDPSTLELIEALMGPAAGAPLLLLQTTRPGFRPPWPMLAHHVNIQLERLSRSDVCDLVESTMVGGQLRQEMVESIADRASGIPLLAEDLARLVRARTDSGQSTEIPDSLAASVTVRLDQVGPAREVAQIAAVIGEEVPPDVLAAVTGRDTEELEPLVDLLVQARILVPLQRSEGRVLAFEHALVRDATYETLLRSRRRELHERVADTIADAFPVLAGAHPDLVARHLASAGRHDRAARAWHEAGSVAISRGAYREAEEAYQEALSSLRGLPETLENDALRLKIQAALLSVLQVTQGYSAPRTAEAAERAKELAERLGHLDELMTEVAGRWAALSSAGQYVSASQIADHFLEIASLDGRPESLANAHMIQMTSRYRLGDLVGAERHFQQGEPLFAEATFLRRLGTVAQTFGNASRNAWMLGRPDEARRRMTHAMAIATTNESPYDVAFSRYMAAILAVLMRNAPEGRRLAEHAIQISDEHGFPQFAAISRIALGRALVDVAPSSTAIELIRGGIQGMAETGSRVAMTLYLAWLAEAEATILSPGVALETIERAMSVNPEEMFYRPEILRVRGDLWSATGNWARAEADLQAALAAATAMRALGLQLRAALSLHRLRSRVGAASATEIVASVYWRFQEGHNTPDLLDASSVIHPTP